MKLQKQNYERLVSYFGKSLEKFGPENVESLYWPRLKDQMGRFEIVCKIADLSNHTILDVGCGVGDLYSYLMENFTEIVYTGIDPVPTMITEAKAKYPDAHFDTIEMGEVTNTYDYIIASGSLTFGIPDGKDFYFEMIKEMFTHANNGVAFNMLDSAIYEADQEFMAYNPYEVAQFCAKYVTKNYKVITGYLPGDFTIYLYK